MSAAPLPPVRVSDDPRLSAEIRAAVAERAQAAYPQALQRVRAGDWLGPEHDDALKARRDAAVRDLRKVAKDPGVGPKGRVRAAIALHDLGDPDGDAHLFRFLAGRSRDLRSAALTVLRQLDGQEVDLTPPERAGRVLRLIDDADAKVAAAAAEVAAARSVPGAADRLAARLRARPTAGLALQLAECAETPDQARLAAGHLFRKTPAEFGHCGYAFGLRRALRHPNRRVAGPIRRALYEYCLRFPRERYSQHLVSDLAEAAGADAVPVLEDVLANATDPASQLYVLAALARLEPARAVDRVLAHARRARRYADHLKILYDHATAADAKCVLAAFRPTKETFADVLSGPYLDGLVRLSLGRFGRAGRREVESWFDRLTGWARTRAAWGLRGLDLKAALKAFVAAGVLPGPARTVYGELRKSGEERAEGFDPTDPANLMTAVFNAGRATTFDAETGMVPCDHDRLVMSFADGRGLFAPECAVQEWAGEDPEDEAPMTVRFVHRDRAFEFQARNLGDWYDVAAVTNAVNAALADAGRPERFLDLEPGGQCPVLVLADPARFRPVAGQFELPLGNPDRARELGVAYERYATAGS